ncbi:unnamed protein product, partial [Medioppia subpectinata]
EIYYCVPMETKSQYPLPSPHPIHPHLCIIQRKDWFTLRPASQLLRPITAPALKYSSIITHFHTYNNHNNNNSQRPVIRHRVPNEE